MSPVITFAVLGALLVIGKVLRMRISFLQRLYLPSSVVGGIVGLIVFTLFRNYIPTDIPAISAKCPGFLINVIFATLFLGAALPKLKDAVILAFPQICLGQIIAWGQYVVGLGLAGFLFTKYFDVPAAFGNLLEIGFEGGHGTVGGMTDSFLHYGWEKGVQLGFAVATVGMITGIVCGMALIQWAYKRGFVKEVRTFEDRRFHERIGVHLRGRRPSAGEQTVFPDSIDSLAWHLSVVAISMAIGYGLWSLIPMKGFPLFPLCMIGGVLLQVVAKLVNVNLLIDRVQMERISGAALDFLVVSAVATIRIDVVAENWVPLVMLCICGVAWSVFCVLFIAPRIIKKSWFECAIAEFGQATGVTATGLLLLRTVDPENRTMAAKIFGYKQLVHEPIMGGGLWTAVALTLVYEIGWGKVLAFSTLMLVLWLGCAAFLRLKRNFKA